MLLLDYDGTLAPFRVQRAKALPYAGVRQALSDVMLTGHTRVVVVSGRACSDLVPLLGMEPMPEVWASHGWERRSADGAYSLSPPPDAAKEGLALAVRRAEDESISARVERKPASVALHWRGLSTAEASSMDRWGRARWGPLVSPHDLELHDFDGGLELRVPGRNKGTVVRAILGQAPPDTVVAYLGDDRTDEDAFLALPRNGLGVLVRREFRPTAASAWIRPPKELLTFLKRWKAAALAHRPVGH